MQKYALFLGFLLLLVGPVSGQNWVEIDLGVGGIFSVDCNVLTTSMRDESGEDLPYFMPLWNMLMLMAEHYAVEDDEQSAEHRAIWDALVTAQEGCSTKPVELTLKNSIWDDPEGDLILIDMVVSDDALCYIMIDLARDVAFATPSERMMARQQFITDCI